MKQPFLFLFLLLSLPVFSQQVWSPDSSATAKNKAYAGLGLDWQKGHDKGDVFSIAAEYGRILNKNASLGVSGRVTWEATTHSGTAFNIHPFLRLNTSFQHPLPNLFVDIGYDFRRRTHDGQNTRPVYFQDFGLRPGLDIALAKKVHLFLQISFTGYAWSLVEGIESSSWEFFRYDYSDRTVGLSFYF